jgi:hypothetical protein
MVLLLYEAKESLTKTVPGSNNLLTTVQALLTVFTDIAFLHNCYGVTSFNPCGIRMKNDAGHSGLDP